MEETFLRTLLPLPPQIKLRIGAKKKIYIFTNWCFFFFHVEIENDCLFVFWMSFIFREEKYFLLNLLAP